MKNSKKLRLKKEIVEALTPIAARYVQGGCSKGEITVISKDCGNKTQKCTLDCSLGTCDPQTGTNCPLILVQRFVEEVLCDVLVIWNKINCWPTVIICTIKKS